MNENELERRIQELDLRLGAAIVALKELWKTEHRALLTRYELSVQDELRAAERLANEIDKRFGTVNEFRQVLSDQQARLITRSEVESSLKALSQELRILNDRVVALTAGSGGRKEGWGYAVGVLGLMMTVMTILSAIGLLILRKG